LENVVSDSFFEEEAFDESIGLNDILCKDISKLQYYFVYLYWRWKKINLYVSTI